jgi:hypothetical protein
LLRRIRRPYRNGIIGKLHNEDLHKFYSSPNDKNDQVKEDEGAGLAVRMKEEEFMQSFYGKTRRKETTEKT